MENLSIILAVIGLAALIFSFWSFWLIKKHLQQFKTNYRHISTLTDEKYFELKSRQDYIIAVSTIVFALLSFIGYTSINNIKKELASQVEKESQNLKSLKDTATENLTTLKLTGRTYEDSVRNALKLVAALKKEIGAISNKDVIKQNIFIVDPLRIGDFPKDKLTETRIIKFNSLTTISGEKLPEFRIPPSIVCFSTTNSLLIVSEVTTQGFKIRPELYTYSEINEETHGTSVQFSLWISQKPS